MRAMNAASEVGPAPSWPLGVLRATNDVTTTRLTTDTWAITRDGRVL
jgi:hypothetical protein